MRKSEKNLLFLALLFSDKVVSVSPAAAEDEDAAHARLAVVEVPLQGCPVC